MILLASAVLMFAAPAVAVTDPPVTIIGIPGFTQQRLTGEDIVRVDGGEPGFPAGVLLTIGRNGRVSEARLTDNDEPVPHPEALLATVRKWTFPPQSFDGRPVSVVTQTFLTFAPAIVAPAKANFPGASAAQTEITLRRGACYGACPTYEVSVRGDGRVRFTGIVSSRFPSAPASPWGSTILWPGTHETRIAPRAAAALIARFRSADFIGLSDRYVARVSDSPPYSLTFKAGATSKQVIDYVGAFAGMPPVVTELEKAVDETAGTERWINGNGETLPLLRAAGIDLRSRSGALLLQAAADRPASKPNPQLLSLAKGVLDAGLDLGTTVPVTQRDQPVAERSIGAILLRIAADRGDAGLLSLLLARDQLRALLPAERTSLFLDGSGCDAGLARALIAAGADPKMTSERGTALHGMMGYGSACRTAPRERKVALLKALVALGVPLYARDRTGATALLQAEDPDVVAALLAAGADPNARNTDGLTPLLTTQDDRIALRLLRAGADPRVSDKEGSVLDHARKNHMPATLAWLAAHGIR